MPIDKILVVGGAGYIGSHMVYTLQEAGLIPIVLDNLSTGHKDTLAHVEHVVGDLADADLLRNIFKNHNIKAVVHFASFSDVAESVKLPFKYYQNNVASLITLLAIMSEFSVKTLIFSSSASVYGNPETLPIKESHPLRPINPYGRSKLMMEEIIKDVGRSHGIHYAIFRYFNVAGANIKTKLTERHQPENHLVPNVLQVAAQIERSLIVHGAQYATRDGTCIRDYIHVQDICDVHLLALKKLFVEKSEIILNIGTSYGHSVLEVIKTAEKVTKKNIAYSIGPARLGDACVLIADASLLEKTFNWKPKYPELETIIQHAWTVF